MFLLPSFAIRTMLVWLLQAVSRQVLAACQPWRT